MTPSAHRTTHTIATTLTTSGTVTKNPAMKLRRSHGMHRRPRHLQPARRPSPPSRASPSDDAVPGERRKTRPSHEHAETGLTTTARAATNAMTNPTTISSPRSARTAGGGPPRGRARTPPAIVGIARKNENSAAAARSSRNSRPPMIVAPDRDTPGTRARSGRRRSPRRGASGVRSARRDDRRGPTALDDEHHEPAATNAIAMTAGSRSSTALTKSAKKRPAISGRDERRQSSSAQTAGRRHRPAGRATTASSFSRYSHITARIEPNWMVIVKTLARVLESQTVAPPAAGAPSTRSAGTR